MNDSGNILLLGDEAVGRELADALDGDRVTHRTDPYDALTAMGRRRWPAVILTAPQAELAGLCRASRRLQRNAGLFALCSVAGESQVRPLVGSLLDDYFLYPPTRDDLARLRRAASQGGAPPAASSAEALLSPHELSNLLEGVRNSKALQTSLAELLEQRLGMEVRWVNADEIDDATTPLLLAAGDPPRVLVSKNPSDRSPSSAEPFLRSLRACLPALTAAAQRTESLHRLAITDHLTGAYNRRYFYHLTDHILTSARRCDFRVTLLLYDIDNFKRYNDKYGHAAGDEILRETASLMKRTSRLQDIVARIGGDEFAVLFWGTDRPRVPDSRPIETAYALAERFRQLVAGHEFPSLGPEARGALTISGGLAAFPRDGQTCRQLLRAADEALKAVKKTGKNAIHLTGRD
ncbi:MAG: GGDEF domain-containing protein [Planctomycetota bacterium]|nr:GGDEF domain-containing protein [Planctomycetota bacterium]